MMDIHNWKTPLYLTTDREKYHDRKERYKLPEVEKTMKKS